MYIGLHVNYELFLLDFNKKGFFLDRFSKSTQNIKFHENPSSGSGVVPFGRRDRQTDGLSHMTKLIFAFRDVANALKNPQEDKITTEVSLISRC
jgi:hypothetical protein